MSEIKVNKISPKQTCTQVTLGDSGDTFTIPAGVTFTNNGTATGFGATGAVNWDTTPKTTTVTAASGVGYFVDTTSGAVTVDLPAGVAGNIVAISDYANTAATNNIVIDPNGSDNIQGVNANYLINVNGGTVTLVYVDSTQGWRPTDAATASSITEQPLFTVATGGTITCDGDFKIHTFTGPGTFTVTQLGNGPTSPLGGPVNVDYLVVAGGGAGGGGGAPHGGSGGGAGGYRTTFPSPGCNAGSFPITATAYPITVGGGGPSPGAGSAQGGSGSSSIFSTITSTGGGGGGATSQTTGPLSALPGGSGGGAGADGVNGGTGNTPPTSPSQGNNGGGSGSANQAGGGGGGIGSTGTPAPAATGGLGGPGTSNSITGSPVAYAGGGSGGGFPGAGRPGVPGGGASSPSGTGAANTGGGGGGGVSSATPTAQGGNGGSGIVVIRYKYQ
jgi:hypothetical protein